MTKLQINFNFNLIQQIRLIHALVESEYLVCIPTEEAPKFNVLKERFGINFANNDNPIINISNHLKFSHSEPMTSVGNVVRPLIFPHSITDYCQTLWANKREYRYSFQGLITEKRRILLESWIEKKLNKSVNFSDKNSVSSKVRNKLIARLGFDSTKKRKIGELLLWESERGRKFPIKAWDDEYFKVLANSEFVLCPSGDYVWSYRFFESALCGAIPIVEESCNAYSGFRFLSFNDDVSDIKWSQIDAEHNFKTCVDRITMPRSILNREIADILRLNG